MRRNRLIWLFLWILSLVGISFYGGPVSYGFFVMLTFIPVISFLYLLIVFLRFRIYQELEGRQLIAGSSTPYYFTLQNEDIFAYSGVRVSFFPELSAIDGLEEDTEYELLPGKGVKKETALTCRYRGEYEVGIRKVVVCDYFRLFSLTYKNREFLTVKVRPRLIVLDSMRHIDMSLMAAKDTPVNPTEPDVLVRDYVPGDDIRYVNWKATARRQQLTVRKLYGEEQPHVGIIMDSKRYSDDRFMFLPLENKMLELVLAISWYLVRKNIPVTLYTMGVSSDGKQALQSSDVHSSESFGPFYDGLSEFRFRSGADSETLFIEAAGTPGVYSNRLIVMILHEWTGESARMAELLNANGVPVLAYIVSDEGIATGSEIVPGETDVVFVPLDCDITEVM